MFYRVLFALIAFIVPAISPAADLPPRSVLIFDASEPNSPWGIVFRDTLRTTLNANTLAPVAIYSEILDLSRFNPKGYEEALGTLLRAKYRDKPIGLIVAHGSLALEVLMRLRAELWSDVPVMFAVVDESTIARLKPLADVTGITLQLQLGNSIKAARVLVPKLKRIVIVGDAWERQAFRSHYVQELSQLKDEFEIIDLSGLSMAKIVERVATLPNDAAIIYTSIYFDDEAGMTYIPRDALIRVAQAANRPVVTDVAPLVGHGSAGGFVAIPQSSGQESARLALRILNGEKASDIPITASESITPMFDWRQLQRFGISENTLPPGSEVLFHELSAWQQYRSQMLAIIAALMVQAALIGWVSYEHRRRHIAEVLARSSMAELTHMNRVATVGEFSASIAHEVNQPLTGIVTRAGAGRRWLGGAKPDIEKARAAFDQIEDAGHRASEIIKTLRSIFKKDHLQDKSLVDVNKLVWTVLELIRVDLQTLRIDLEPRFDHRIPPVLGNEVQLQQVVLNLITNAVDSMRSAKLRVLSISTVLSDPDRVQVSIEDTGTGIDPANINQIFKPMFTTKDHGMGMGLSICHSIIENHDGRISVAAGSKSGTIFHFDLPTNAA